MIGLWKLNRCSIKCLPASFEANIHRTFSSNLFEFSDSYRLHRHGASFFSGQVLFAFWCFRICVMRTGLFVLLKKHFVHIQSKGSGFNDPAKLKSAKQNERKGEQNEYRIETQKNCRNRTAGGGVVVVSVHSVREDHYHPRRSGLRQDDAGATARGGVL